jgi:hypothetical protein
LSQRPSHRLALAVVHAPFRPVGYVLVDAHLLLPATWEDPVRSAPGTGGLVAVNVPYGQLRPDLSPLTAYPPEQAAEPRAEAVPEPTPPSDPPVDPAPPRADAPEEVPSEEKSPEAAALEES